MKASGIKDYDEASDEHKRGLLSLAHERLRFVTPPVAKAGVNGVHSGAARVRGMAGIIVFVIYTQFIDQNQYRL